MDRRKKKVHLTSLDLASDDVNVDLTDGPNSNSMATPTLQPQPSNGSLPNAGGEGISFSPASPMVVTHTEDTTESAADAIEEFLQQRTHHSPASSALRPFAAMLDNIRSYGREKGSPSKKAPKKFSSVDDAYLSSIPEDGVAAEVKRNGGSTPSSPRLTHKGNHSPKLFHRAKGSLLRHFTSHDKSHDTPLGVREMKSSKSVPCSTTEDYSTGGEGIEPSTNSQESENGSRKKKKKQASTESERPLKISSPLRRDWSGSELRNEDLQLLVHPPPAAWAKCGFLWLRKLTENNRYAWTHIVSTCTCTCVYDTFCVWVCVRERERGGRGREGVGDEDRTETDVEGRGRERERGKGGKREKWRESRKSNFEV